jgi:ribose/xylose/arabinose/galactoside ABC-type transport system permease subunit
MQRFGSNERLASACGVGMSGVSVVQRCLSACLASLAAPAATQNSCLPPALNAIAAGNATVVAASREADGE